MENPPMTVENFRENLPNLFEFLKYCAGSNSDTFFLNLEDHLEEFSSENGGNYRFGNKAYNIRIGWNRDDADKINGLFFRSYTSNSIQAYKLTGLVDNELIEISSDTTVHKKQLNNFASSGIIDPLSGLFFDACAQYSFIRQLTKSILFTSEEPIPYEGEISCNIENLQEKEKVKRFFEKNKDMLPDPLREHVFYERNYFYIGGAILCIIGMVFIARKYIFQPESNKPIRDLQNYSAV